MLGELAQLARAPALHAGGHRFDSGILHQVPEKSGISLKFYLIKFRYSLDEIPNQVGYEQVH